MNEPLTKTVRVCCPLEHAFRVFTGDIDLWWPVGHRKLDGSTLVLEPKVGGRFFERDASGKEFKLGDVSVWDPVKRVHFTWFLGAIGEPTHVTVTFSARGHETLVEVVHSEANSELGAQWPGRVALFERGWTRVLEAFAGRALKGKRNDELD